MTESDESGSAYRPTEVEAKWREIWEEEGTNLFSREELEDVPDPFYNLLMFPYPSGEGLHIGNMYAFTGADVHARFQRLRGHDVFEPIGFDAFGIHSENYALEVGTHPMDLIPRNVANFTRQLRRIGGMFDWRHTVDTTDPEYYRWTQWIFLQFFDAGLAERKEAPVNWCPSCKTVLANEQVVGGHCERCDTPVEQRRIAQWFFRITDYAQRLLDNLPALDWSETTKKAQENWIGRSEGAEMHFPVLPAAAGEGGRPDEAPEGDGAADEGQSGEAAAPSPPRAVDPAVLHETGPTVSVFTTRPDTVFGATYMVLAPEHPLVEEITPEERRAEIDAYRERARAKDLVSRKKAEKEKSGVFTGAYCLNPATGEPIPVWIADYVLMEYGTGAIMAVPAHDQRDLDFARTHELPVRRVVAGPDDDASTPVGDEAYLGAGRLVNSEHFDDLPVEEGGRAVTGWLEKRGLAEARVNYRLHDWCISRQRYWGPPIPIVHCEECGTVPVPEEDLPVVLPRVEDFRPDVGGVSPMARVEEWYRVECPACGGEGRRETDVSDTFLDSSWYFLRYPSTDRDDVALDPEMTRRWLPVDTYIGGNEHAVLHLMYARFVTMALHDLGHLDFEEPFTRFRAHGLITRGGSKMSKSRGNMIIPDPIIEEYGADTFRTYLMFMGPFEESADWQDEGIQGPHGFLHRLWDTVVDVVSREEEKEGGGPAAQEPSEGKPADGNRAPPDGTGPTSLPGPVDDAGVERLLHQTIARVDDQVPDLQYNTAIAAMMEYLNALRTGGRRATRNEVEPLVVMVAPFAPHLAEELWSRLGRPHTLFSSAGWPEDDPEKAAEDTVEIAVQVDGRLRGTIQAAPDTGRDALEARAREEENVARHLEEAEIRRVVVVPGRLVNFVTG